MIFVYATVALLLGVPALLALVGLFLPRAHQAERAARLRSPPSTVWALVSDYERAAAWRPDLKRVEVLPPRDGRPSYVEHGRHGAIPYVVERLDPPQRLVVRILDAGLPFGGTWTFSLHADEGGTRLTIREDGFIKNPLFRTLSRTIFSTTATMEAYLAALRARLGE